MIRTFLRALPRRLARAVIYLAAAAMADWSLYVVAHGIYGVPKAIAVLVAAVFDGTALLCLQLASDAVREGRSAAGPRLAAVVLLGVSVYLNVTHAVHDRDGLPAAILFASPTAALLVASDLSWAATRAEVRAARGEAPYRLPVFGIWGWMLAGSEAWTATKAGAVQHVTGARTAPALGGSPTAEQLAGHELAEMHPAEAVRLVAELHPELAPGELASLLAEYGVTVAPQFVALVLGQRRPTVQVEREADDAQRDAPDVGALPPPSKTAAILEAASHLPPAAPASDVVERVAAQHGLNVSESYVRTVLSRDNRKPKPVDGVGQGGGGYA